MPYPWGHQRRYNSYREYFIRRFGGRVQKLSLDAGFTCPNRDGTLGTGGCTFCSNEAFNPSYCRISGSITDQLREGMEFHKTRYRRSRHYLAYFQTYSNTYAPLPVLREKYEEALAFPGVMGLVIGTRPDCISDEILGYLARLSEKHYIAVEYGVESCYDHTLERVNRCHTFAQSEDAIRKTSAAGIITGAHLIFGLPGESCEDILKEACMVSQLPLHTLKFHQLQILLNTPMEAEYRKRPYDFPVFSHTEYMDLVIDFMERLNPRFIVERFSAEVPPRYLAGPSWGNIRADEISRMTEQRMEERNAWQGRLFTPDCEH